MVLKHSVAMTSPTVGQRSTLCSAYASTSAEFKAPAGTFNESEVFLIAAAPMSSSRVRSLITGLTLWRYRSINPGQPKLMT